MKAVLSSLVLAALSAPPIGAQSEVVLRPADIEPGLRFGTAVSLSGTGLLVGAPGNGSTVTGRAYVFRLTPAGWVEEQELEAPGAAGFGKATALLGDLAFVGAESFVHSSGNASGAVFVFERTASGWGAPTLLLPSDAATTASFGHDIAVDSDRLLVAGETRAYVFDLSGGAWTETATLAGEPLPLEDVDLDGNRAVLAHSEAFVFEFDSGGSGWDSGTELDSSGGMFPASGRWVALDGDRVAAVSMTANICMFPELHGYERHPTEWKKSAIVFGFDTGTRAAEMDGGRLVVAGSDWLTVYRTLPSGGWVEEEERTAGVGTGASGGTDISGNLSVKGIPGDPTGGPFSGSVSVFELMSLTALPESVSVVSGGTQELELRRSPLAASSLFWIFGSATGTSPGMTVGGLPLPLNFDAYYLFLVLNPNTLVNPTIGILGGSGQALSEIALPSLSPTLVGVTLNHVYLTFDLSGEPFVNFVSNPVPLRFTTESDLPPEDFEAGALGWTFGTGWQTVEDGACGAVTRMAAYTSAAPACGGNLSFPIQNARLTSSTFRLGEVTDYELRLDSILTPGLKGRIRLFVSGPPSAYFEVALPSDFSDIGVLESLTFQVPGIEYAIGEDARIEFLLNGSVSGTPGGWWIDNVELVELP